MRLSLEEVKAITFWASKAMDDDIARKFATELKKRAPREYADLRKNGHIYPAWDD